MKYVILQIKSSKNPVVRLSGLCYNLVTSAGFKHCVIVWRTLTRAFLQFYHFESPVFGQFFFVLSGFFYRIKRGACKLVVSIRIFGNRVTSAISLVLLNDELYDSLFNLILSFVSFNSLVVFYCHYVFNERLTRSLHIIANRVLILDHFVSRVGLSRAIIQRKMKTLDQPCSHIFGIFKNSHHATRSKIAAIDYPQEYLAYFLPTPIISRMI